MRRVSSVVFKRGDAEKSLLRTSENDAALQQLRRELSKEGLSQMLIK
jgi:hypothetical protein